MSIRYLTAGESHGTALCGIIEGFPAGIEIAQSDFDTLMLKRKQGYGRGKRSQLEPDKVEVLSGIIGGKTIGSPISLLIRNQDYQNHQHYMSPFEIPAPETALSVPLPGHADLAGAVKHGVTDCRHIRERASARETAMRVALSVPARNFLAKREVVSLCFVEAIGGTASALDLSLSKAELERQIQTNAPDFFTPDSAVTHKWKSLIDGAMAKGETLGGTAGVIFYNLPIGLGNYIQADLRLDAKLAAAAMSIPGIKGVEIGFAKEVSEMQENSTDGIAFNKARQCFERLSNHAGGIEGGMSSGAPLIIRFHMKPLPANSKSESIDLKTLEKAKSLPYRSDVCAVQAASVVVESVASVVLAGEMLSV